MDDLHEQEFVTLLVNVPSDVMRTHFQSCVGPTTSVQLLTYLTTLTFCLSLVHFCMTLRTCFGLPHPIVTCFSCCQHGHAISFNAHVGMNTLQPTIFIQMSLSLLFWKVEHTLKKRFPTFSPTTFDSESIFLLLEMAFEP
jgi:hypothetical protein